MGVNFKLLFEQTGKLVLVYLMELRGLYWQLSFNKNKIFSIKILPGHVIKLARKGDIAQIIYKNELLVKYEKSFEFNIENLSANFDEVIQIIKNIFNEGLKNTPFTRIHLFYIL